MNKTLFLIIALLVITVSVPATLFFSNDARLFVKFQIYHRKYLSWKSNGGPYKIEYYEPLMHDRYRDELIYGLTIKEALVKFPFLTDDETYPGKGYKGHQAFWEQERNPECKIKIYWLTPEDTMDWAFVFVNGIGQEIRLIKG
jgi:hypothetical protein